ncbi:hypothetical protein HW115_05375 [Verrucomicrobiaceae bacterium N1E253]|uniref:Bacterial Ig-like domain-containing protein n=1 Tax=Oceaniferula marina TaxID=2748318 RepID=A0A851GCX0_9BACT|nr:Ig-like domain-containing protein [Oceaniferula marina]NWK55029.1 hypothetical protein [Oceaniferula marina]
MKLNTLFSASTILLGLVTAATAAPIIWQAAQHATGKSDLIEGSIILSASGGSGASITGGGSSGTSTYAFTKANYADLTFTPVVTSNDATASSTTNSTGDTNFDQIIDSFSYTTSGTAAGAQTISGLTPGQRYRLQIFFNDQRSATSSRVMSYGDGESSPNTVNLTAGAGNWGQYAIGTFTADGNSQQLTHKANGFANLHYTALLVVEDESVPLATLSTTTTSVSAPFTVTLTFSEAITGLAENDFSVSNGSIQPGSLSGSGTDWSMLVTPTSNGDVTIQLPANSVTDTDGENNQNPASDILSITYVAPGSEQPTPTLSTAGNSVTSAFTVNLTFNEAVTGLELSDFDVQNASLSNLSGNGSNYTLLVTPEEAGDVTLTLPAKRVTDTDGDKLTNTHSNTLVVNYAPPVPVAIYGPLTSPTPEFEVHLSFPEAVTGLDANDFIVQNGKITQLNSGGKRNFAKRFFCATVQANAPGAVQISLPAGVVASISQAARGNAASNTFTTNCSADFGETWTIDTQEEWSASQHSASNLTLANGMLEPTADNASFSSTVKSFTRKQKALTISFGQSPVWDNWTGVPNVGASGAGDATILLPLSDKDYYHLGRGSTGGYHAWHSTDMVNWTHHGPITAPVHRWVTSAEYKDGKFYIYVDHPNDHTPHLYIDDNLKDGIIGTFMGMAFNDPTHGSDCSVFRDNADGLFHIIHEDWTPIKASTHSWDSPLAGHTSSEDGFTGFQPAEHLPPIDHRTTPTGEIGTYTHPHVAGSHISNPCEYEIHSPGQDAFGDWTSIKVGSQYYLFADYDVHGAGIKCARFTSSSIYKEFTLAGSLGGGHPDPTVGFAEGQFYLITQQSTDYISPGPWVDGVEARAGVDTDGDGTVDQWTTWQNVQESYDHTPGYARVVSTTPAQIDLSALPEGFGFQFEFRIDNTVVSGVSPIIDKVSMQFKPSRFQQWANDEETTAIPAADHNNNGLANVIEFALGITQLPDLHPDADGKLALTVTEAGLQDGYSLDLEYSADMQTWHRATANSSPIKQVSATTQTNGDLTLSFQFVETVSHHLFWRLRVH